MGCIFFPSSSYISQWTVYILFTHRETDERTVWIYMLVRIYIYILATAESIYEEGRPHRDTHREKEPVNLVWGLAFISCLSSCYVSCPHEVEVVEYHTRLRTNPLSLSLSVVVSLLLYLKHSFFFFFKNFHARSPLFYVYVLLLLLLLSSSSSTTVYR